MFPHNKSSEVVMVVSSNKKSYNLYKWQKSKEVYHIHRTYADTQAWADSIDPAQMLQVFMVDKTTDKMFCVFKKTTTNN